MYITYVYSNEINMEVQLVLKLSILVVQRQSNLVQKLV